MPIDEFDRPPLMNDAHDRRRELEADDKQKDSEAWERLRPQPMLSQRPSPVVIGALALAGLAAVYLLVSILSAPAAPPRALPTVAAPAPAQPAPAIAPPAQVEAAPTPAPLPTGYIIGTEPQAPAQLAPQALPVYVEAPVVYSELVPLAEPTPADPMACARRGIGACRGSRP
jgi:hypothetical protein